MWPNASGSLVNCRHCGRDTRNRSRICTACTRQVTPKRRDEYAFLPREDRYDEESFFRDCPDEKDPRFDDEDPDELFERQYENHTRHWKMPLYCLATFTPKRTDDLHPDCLPIGHRGVWESSRVIADGPYAGQREWSPATPGRWIPECDLSDIQFACCGDFSREQDWARYVKRKKQRVKQMQILPG